MDSTFKKMLRAELDYQDIKVKELSAKTGISARTLEGYLNARGSIPPADVAVKIAQILNVTVEYLVTGNPMYNRNQLQNQPKQIIDQLTTLSVEKKQFIRDFINLLDDYELHHEQ